MKYPLEVMCKMRKMREQTIQAELARCERLLQEAIDHLQAQERLLQEYRVYRRNYEARLLSAIRGKPVKLGELEEIQLKIERLYNQEASYLHKIDNARRLHRQAEMNVERTRIKLQQAVKAKLKLDEHRSIWLQAETSNEIKRTEEEIEDLMLGKYTKK